MTRLSQTFLAGLCCSIFASLPAQSQPPACPEGMVAWEDEITRRIFNIADAENDEVLDAAVEQPLTSPDQTQLTAPDSSDGGTSLVDEASFPSLFGLAVDNGLVQTDTDKITLNLNLFAFKALAQPQALSSQTEYEKYDNLRRFGGALTFGGQGESFDRDGDGEPDEALAAQNLDDIITYELRIRLSKSRDRRDPDNYNEIFSLTDRPLTQFDTAISSFRVRHATEINAVMDSNGCMKVQDFESFVSRNDVEREIEEIASFSQATVDALQQAVERIDRKPLLTLVVGGVERKDEFGPSSLKAELRGSLANHTLNLEYVTNDSPTGDEDPQTLRLGYKYSMLMLKDSPFIPEGIELTFAGSYEKFEDVPDALHDENAKANVRFDFPLTRAVKIPVSVTWANHKDLLTDENEIRGHIGFSVDLSKLTKPANDTGSSGGSQ